MKVSTELFLSAIPLPDGVQATHISLDEMRNMLVVTVSGDALPAEYECPSGQLPRFVRAMFRTCPHIVFDSFEVPT